MAFFSTGRNQTITEEIQDGYCKVSLKKDFLKKLKKDLEKQANIDYEKFQKALNENNGIPVIPSDFNANAAKQRMQIESAIDDNNIIGIQINEDDDCYFDLADYTFLEQKLINKSAEAMLIQSNDISFIICTNDEKNVNLVANTVYEDILDKREESGQGIVKRDGCLNKNLSINEELFVKEKIANEILNELYNGDIELAMRLLSGDERLVKIIIQEKHRKDIEKILIHLQINHLSFNDSLIIGLNDLEFMNDTVANYTQGAIIIKDKNIYGLKIREEVRQQNSEKIVQNIDNIIDRLQDKKRDAAIVKNYGEITK